MSKAFKWDLYPFKKADLVLVICTPMIVDKNKEKLEPNWEGPFVSNSLLEWDISPNNPRR